MHDTCRVKTPEIWYARSGEVAIAYQEVGLVQFDIVFIRGMTGDLLSTWDQPLLVRHVEGLGTSGRVLMLDRRGTGLSDRVREVQSLETTMDDIRSVTRRRGNRPRGGLDRPRQRGYRCAVRRDLSGAVRRVDSPGARSARNSHRRPSVGFFRNNKWRARLRAIRTGWGDREFLEALGRGRAGARGRGQPGIARLVRGPHASESQPGRGTHRIPHADGKRMSRMSWPRFGYRHSS